MAALYDVQTLTCEASLFFQYEGGRQVCRRRLLLDYDLPTLQRHGSVWVYHFPDRHQVLIRCPRGVSRSEVLHGAGIIHGATSCSIASRKIRTLPELRGSADVRFDTPEVYLPDLPKILTDREMPQIEQGASTKTDGIDSIQRSLAATPRLLDVDTLFHVHQTSLSDDFLVSVGWIVSATAVACCVLLIVYLIYRAQISNCVGCPAAVRGPVSNTGPEDTPSRSVTSTEDNEAESLRSQVAFTNYSLHQPA
jgi:hypothetical protein